MFNPGRCKTRISFIDKNHWEENAVGEQEQVPKELFREFAEIRTLTGKEILTHGRVEGQVPYRIFMRYRSEVHIGLLMKFNGIYVEITSIIPNGRYMEIQGVETVDLSR